MFEIGGIVLSLFAIPETTKPNPIKTTRPIKAKTSILSTVITPCISVNLKKKWPITIMNIAPNNAKPILAIPSPKTMLDFLTGVAKNRFITRFCLKLKNTNAVPKTPVLSREKPSCPGSIKSIVLYVLPLTVLSLNAAIDGSTSLELSV